MEQVWSGAETFFYKKGKIGCLLLHGGTGTPAVMKPIGKFLAENDISALGVKLKGYGTSLDDWLKSNHLDWIASAEEGLGQLERDCENVFVSGLSMGASLALYLAGKHQKTVAGVISICAPAGPHFLKGFRDKFLPLAKENKPQANFSATDIKDENVKPGGYDCHYPSLNLEWAELVEKANLGLSAIQCPALIIQAKNDHVVDPKTGEWIYNNIGSKQKDLCWLDNSFHMAVIDVDKEIVFQKAVAFVYQVIK
ncbi:MAG: alpha/beta fold hydrolase [Deltaproteobacteria bacterium]|nr:alpha/beta fold hydrolase [Deltaproteobacteria bacterium]